MFHRTEPCVRLVRFQICLDSVLQSENIFATCHLVNLFSLSLQKIEYDLRFTQKYISN